MLVFKIGHAPVDARRAETAGPRQGVRATWPTTFRDAHSPSGDTPTSGPQSQRGTIFDHQFGKSGASPPAHPVGKSPKSVIDHTGGPFLRY